ncbi:Rossmann-like and DUF2520 domain-containing protein [Reichenbachiella ulvae]|uniref:DUF2520 domain-containing protein n=1 Tax=Reichenbachiella ulvae TaxID=2980104 RepID=A0ABT3CVV9_9BACT|nr:DUF2520 domain-containing protein [Reichenbachiella ulvae]MCV9387727.1 DUF2520 domain-containing protein [Reichenbachiella ulvae]
MKVTLIGGGKVAKSLMAEMLAIEVLHEVYVRNEKDRKLLALNHPHVRFPHQLDFTDSESNFFILAVSDSAIEEIAEQIDLPIDAILAHTSGTIPLDSLNKKRSAVFYPLQTFAEGQLTQLQNVPLLIEATDPDTFKATEALARRLSNNVIAADSAFRAQIHLAAVFASNFSNRMLYAAEQILSEMGQELNLIEPLVLQSIQNVFRKGANESLTGPAQREDQVTIEKQKHLLEQSPELQELYQTLTKYILSSKTAK